MVVVVVLLDTGGMEVVRHQMQMPNLEGAGSFTSLHFTTLEACPSTIGLPASGFDVIRYRHSCFLCDAT